MNPLSLHHLTMINAGPLALIDAAAAGGFEYCGMRIIGANPAEPVAALVGNPALTAEVAARLDATGVRLLDIEVVWLQPDTDIARLVPALEVGRRLGARNVITIPVDSDLGRVRDNFSRLCEAAAALDMKVGLEFLTYCSVGTLQGALDILDQSGQPNAQLIVDPLQYFRSGAAPGELASVNPAYLNYMQLCDAPRAGPVSVEDKRREARTDRLLPGEGELPLAALIRHFRPGIPLSLEVPNLRLAGLPFNEQGRIIGEAARRFLGELAAAPAVAA